MKNASLDSTHTYCVSPSVTDAEAPILWSLDGQNQLLGKDTDAGKDRGQEEKRMTGQLHFNVNHHTVTRLIDGCCIGRVKTDELVEVGTIAEDTHLHRSPVP